MGFIIEAVRNRHKIWKCQVIADCKAGTRLQGGSICEAVLPGMSLLSAD